MNCFMRLFRRKETGMYYVETSRNKRRSLKTDDKKEAEKIFREMQKLWLKGRLVELEKYKKITLTEFKKEYLALRTDEVSKWTLKKDELSLNLLLDAVGGSLQLRALNKERLSEFKKVCKARGASEITINGYLRHIKSALSYALDEKYIDKKPKVVMYKASDQEDLIRVLKPEEINLILKVAKEEDKEIWIYLLFQLWTGARRREGLGLTWQKIDFKARNCRIKGKDRRERIVPLLGPIIKVLKPIRKDIGNVFKQYYPDTWSKIFKRIARRCGIEDARLHDLRHSAATYMLRSGIPLEVVSDILGHSQMSTTKIYTHILDDIKQKEMKKLKFK